MRVRILRKPPEIYGIDVDSLLMGRVYNIASELASALLLDGHAELYDTLTPDEKRERSQETSHMGWTAADKHTPWTVRSKKE